MYSSGFFRIKPIARLILKHEISGSHTISDRSLLLSTIVLNDKGEVLRVCLSFQIINCFVYWTVYLCIAKRHDPYSVDLDSIILCSSTNITRQMFHIRGRA